MQGSISEDFLWTSFFTQQANTFPKQEKRGNSMRQNYEKLRKKVLEFGTINLTDFELNQLLFLEEDLKEEAAQKELMRICAD